MRLVLLIAIVALLLGSWVGGLILHDSGYVLLAYGRWSVEMSLWVAVVLQGLALIGFYLLLRLLFGLVQTPAAMRRWLDDSRLRRSNRNIARGLRLFAEGRWPQARKDLVSSAADSEFPLVNYLVAAWAADRDGDDRHRDELLDQALAAEKDSRLAVELTRARILMERGEWQQASELTEALRSDFPRHAYVRQLLLQCYLRSENWQALGALLPDMKRNQPADEQHRLEVRVYRALLQKAEGRSELQVPAEERLRRINEIWSSCPARVRSDESVTASYVGHLMALGAEPRAEQVLRSALRGNWSHDLVRLYGLVAGEDPGRQLQIAEEWLKLHPENAVLLLTLGRLSLRNELWGKARNYLEASLALIKSPEAFAELGRLLEFLGEHQAGQECFRQGVERMAPDLIRISLPENGVRAPLATRRA